MVKVYAPCLSLDASGTIADAITFTKWKGRNVARQRVIPSNPRSGPQTGMRAMFAFLAKVWQSLTTAEQATWDDRAKADNISPFNAQVGYNQDRWRRFLCPSAEDPADETGTQPGAAVVTPTGGIRQIKLSIADDANAPDYAYLIFRSETGTFTPGYDNCIAVVDWDNSGTTVYVDAPLTPGTYYYQVIGTLKTGLKGIASTEVSAAAT